MLPQNRSSWFFLTLPAAEEACASSSSDDGAFLLKFPKGLPLSLVDLAEDLFFRLSGHVGKLDLSRVDICHDLYYCVEFFSKGKIGGMQHTAQLLSAFADPVQTGLFLFVIFLVAVFQQTLLGVLDLGKGKVFLFPQLIVAGGLLAGAEPAGAADRCFPGAFALRLFASYGGKICAEKEHGGGYEKKAAENFHKRLPGRMIETGLFR